MVKLPEDEDTPQKRVAKIFRMMDKDEVGSLSSRISEAGVVDHMENLERELDFGRIPRRQSKGCHDCLCLVALRRLGLDANHSLPRLPLPHLPSCPSSFFLFPFHVRIQLPRHAERCISKVYGTGSKIRPSEAMKHGRCAGENESLRT